VLVAAAGAFDSEQTALEPAAVEILLELVAHESRQGGTVLGEMREERPEVLLDDGVKGSLLGVMARVAGLRLEGVATGSGREELALMHPPD